MNMLSRKGVALVAIGVVVGLVGCDRHSTQYYSSHPEARQDMLEDCNSDAGRAQAECQSADQAQQQHTRQNSPQSNPS